MSSHYENPASFKELIKLREVVSDYLKNLSPKHLESCKENGFTIPFSQGRYGISYTSSKGHRTLTSFRDESITITDWVGDLTPSGNKGGWSDCISIKDLFSVDLNIEIEGI